MIHEQNNYFNQTQSIGWNMLLEYTGHVFVVPTDRVTGIPFEDRTTYISSEDRTTHIQFENRTTYMGGET